MTQQEMLFCTKPGQNISKNRNRSFKQKQQKLYKNDKNARINNQTFYNYALWIHDKTQQQAVQQKLYKVGRHGNRLTGFNFKKCSATKFMHGTGMYTYSRFCDTFDKELDQQRNNKKKQNSKLRNKICMNYQTL